MTGETRSGVRQASAEEVMWTLSEAVAEIERLRAEVQKTADRPAWIRNYVECAAERDRLRAAQAWQPIETAPRDGTAFLAALSGGDVVRLYAPAAAAKPRPRYLWWMGGPCSLPIVDTHPPDTEWRERPLATHWRPLPDAPA